MISNVSYHNFYQFLNRNSATSFEARQGCAILSKRNEPKFIYLSTVRKKTKHDSTGQIIILKNTRRVSREAVLQCRHCSPFARLEPLPVLRAEEATLAERGVPFFEKGKTIALSGNTKGLKLPGNDKLYRAQHAAQIRGMSQ